MNVRAPQIAPCAAASEIPSRSLGSPRRGERNPLSAARGIALGCALGGLIWAAIFAWWLS